MTQNTSMIKNIRLLLIICIGIASLFIIAFLLRFLNIQYQFSKFIADWGDFGSYLSGSIGLIVAIANLVAFLILTIEVSKIQDINNKKQLQFQEQTIITNLKNDEIKRISMVLISMGDEIGDIIMKMDDISNENINKISPKIIWIILKAENLFNTFCLSQANLFGSINDAGLKKNFIEMKMMFINYSVNFDQAKFAMLLDDYNKNYVHFIKGLHENLLNGLKTE